MKRRIAIALLTLLAAGTASAATEFVPTLGLGEPIEITVGQTIDIVLRLETDLLVGQIGSISAFFDDSAGLTINSCTDIDAGGNAVDCSFEAGSGWWEAIGSDYGTDGINDEDAIVTINVTGNVVGGTVTLLTQADDPAISFLMCSGTLVQCIPGGPGPDGVATPFDNEGELLVRVVVPEQGTAVLVSMGLVSLAMLRRRAR